MTIRTVRFINSLCLMFLGAYVFATVLPHRMPWQMISFARLRIIGEKTFYVRLPFLPDGFLCSKADLLLAAFVLAALLIASIPFHHWKSSLRSLRSHTRAFFAGLIASEFFILTLIPGEPDFVRDGASVIFYLVMSTLGAMLFIVGMMPVITRAVEMASFKEFLRRTYLFARRCFLDSPVPLFLGILFIIELIAANVISYYVFDHLAHVQDSIAQLFHAKIFAKGVLTAPAPPAPEFFDFTHAIINEGKWYSQYPPGHSFLLMFGVFIGAPWLINPFFGAFTVVLLYFLGKELHGEAVGRLSALLALLSPFLLFMNSEYMNHTSALFFFVIFLLFFVKAMKNGRLLDGAVAGAALGWFVLIRPYSAAALSLPFLLYGFTQLLRRFREVRNATIGFTVLLLVMVGILLSFNFLTNGDPLLFGYELRWGPQTNPGFGNAGWGEPLTPLRAMHQTVSNLNGMNKYLFELPIPSLLFVVLLFLSGQKNRWDYLFVAGFLTLAGAYFFYWFQDWCFGPRFLFESSALIIILTARAIQLLPHFWKNILGFSTSVIRVRIASFAVIGLLFLIGHLTNIPPHIRFYSKSYWRVTSEPLRALEKQHITRALIFAKSRYGSVFQANDPFLKEGNIYAINNSTRNHILMDCYPELPAFRVDGSTIERLPR